MRGFLLEEQGPRVAASGKLEVYATEAGSGGLVQGRLEALLRAALYGFDKVVKFRHRDDYRRPLRETSTADRFTTVW